MAATTKHQESSTKTQEPQSRSHNQDSLQGMMDQAPVAQNPILRNRSQNQAKNTNAKPQHAPRFDAIREFKNQIFFYNRPMAKKMTTEELNQRLEAADKAICALYRAAKELAVASREIEQQVRARHVGD